MRRDRDAMESLLVIINSRTPLSGYVWERDKEKQSAWFLKMDVRVSVKSDF